MATTYKYNVPIWKDTYYTYTTQGNKYVDYVITDAADTVLYSGRAFSLYNNNVIDINVSDVCMNYLSSSIIKDNEIKNNLEIDEGYYQIFNLKILNEAGQIVEIVPHYFFNDWSYATLENISDKIVSLNRPINTSLPPGAYVPVSFLYGYGVTGDKKISLKENY